MTGFKEHDKRINKTGHAKAILQNLASGVNNKRPFDNIIETIAINLFGSTNKPSVLDHAKLVVLESIRGLAGGASYEGHAMEGDALESQQDEFLKELNIPKEKLIPFLAELRDKSIPVIDNGSGLKNHYYSKLPFFEIEKKKAKQLCSEIEGPFEVAAIWVNTFGVRSIDEVGYLLLADVELFAEEGSGSGIDGEALVDAIKELALELDCFGQIEGKIEYITISDNDSYIESDEEEVNPPAKRSRLDNGVKPSSWFSGASKTRVSPSTSFDLGSPS